MGITLMIIEKIRRELQHREEKRKQISRKKGVSGCSISSQQDTEDEEFS